VAPGDLQGDPELTEEAAVFPDELRDNRLFRRQGTAFGEVGDFFSLKEIATDFGQMTTDRGFEFTARNVLITAYQYVIAKFDIDGFRIDTLKHVERPFARIFGNAMREFGLSIGKKNFFTFGEVFDNEEKLAQYTGRFASDPDDLVGVDATLDFPLFFTLPSVLKGFFPPSALAGLFQHRRDVQTGRTGGGVLISTHGEAGQFFTTFLDNHDQRSRFRFELAGNPTRFDDQVSMGVGCLYSLLGIPVLYYGTEQGLHGAGDSDENVREALWENRTRSTRTTRSSARCRQSPQFGRASLRCVTVASISGRSRGAARGRRLRAQSRWFPVRAPLQQQGQRRDTARTLRHPCARHGDGPPSGWQHQ
jgi:glycosidase